jgi:hypothetical protein
MSSCKLVRHGQLDHTAAPAGATNVADVVSWFAAIQAQEYEVARWAIAIRMRDRAADTEILIATGRSLAPPEN